MLQGSEFSVCVCKMDGSSFGLQGSKQLCAQHCILNLGDRQIAQ